MARRDVIHDSVKNALENDGWTITDDPLTVIVEGGKGVEIDLGAEKFIVAEKNNKKIAVEIKSFLSSLINGFHQVLGQFLGYSDALAENNIDRELFIAISEDIHNNILEFPFILRLIEKYEVKLLIVDIENEKIVEWKK